MTKIALPHLQSQEQQVHPARAANDLGGLRTLPAAHHRSESHTFATTDELSTNSRFANLPIRLYHDATTQRLR